MDKFVHITPQVLYSPTQCFTDYCPTSKYAAAEHTDYCMCSDVPVGKMELAPDGHCRVPCGGGTGEHCGAMWRNLALLQGRVM